MAVDLRLSSKAHGRLSFHVFAHSLQIKARLVVPVGEKHLPGHPAQELFAVLLGVVRPARNILRQLPPRDIFPRVRAKMEKFGPNCLVVTHFPTPLVAYQQNSSWGNA